MITTAHPDWFVDPAESSEWNHLSQMSYSHLYRLCTDGTQALDFARAYPVSGEPEPVTVRPVLDHAQPIPEADALWSYADRIPPAPTPRSRPPRRSGRSRISASK